jgi:hypothetical protein
MQKLILFFIVLIGFSGVAKSQKSKIEGKVINAANGEILIGATISIEGTKKSMQSDQNGYFSFSGLDKGKYKLTASYVSFTSKSINVEIPKEGEVITNDIVLDRATDMSSVVVKSTSGGSRKPVETVSSLLIAQKNSASVSDGISAETIKRTPDRNTGDILKRVSGASLQDDKFAVIRGLNDRYNTASLNGAPLPSSESDRKAFAFDIFPANMLDNLVITKTATPDMPAEFAGGQILITTKGIPSENYESFSIGMGFNTQSTFRQRKFSEIGQWDFLGIDSYRKLPTQFPGIQAFKDLSVNDRLPYAKNFNLKNWAYETRTALPNTNFQYIIARNIQRKEKDFFGLLMSVTYQKSLSQNNGDRTFFAPEYNNAPQRVYQEEFNSVQTLLGVIGNMSFKLNNNHSLSLKNIFSINADDRVITRDGKNDIINEPNQYFKSYALWFTSNQIFSSQLIGEHYIPSTKLKINWVASISDIKREIPALRRMAFDSTTGDAGYIAKLVNTAPVDNDNTAGLTFYSTNKEVSHNAKIDFSRNFKFKKDHQINAKFGGYYQMRDRDFNPRLLAFSSFDANRFNSSILTVNPSTIFQKKYMGYLSAGKTGLNLRDITEIRDLYTAGTELYAYYGMLDQRLGKKLRMIYGARVEHFHQTLNAEFNQFTPVRVNTRKTDILPSANFVYSINTKQNLRLSYSKTVNRPEFRELAPFLFRDYTIRYSVFGDTSLRRAMIDNFDFRYEFFPGKAQLITGSLFYKKFVDPIELISTNQERTLSYKNTPSATLLGAEFEFRTKIGSLIETGASSIWNKLTVYGNLSIIKSDVKLNVIDTNNYYYKQGRVMQGQSPYVLNGGVTYQDDEKNISSTLSFNRYGQRIFLASNGDATQDGLLIEPNLWENGRTQIDFQFTKSFPKKNIDIKLNVKDILAQQLVFFEDTNNNKKYDNGIDAKRSSLNFGRVISFTISHKF